VVETDDEAALRAHASADPAVTEGIGEFEFGQMPPARGLIRRRS
jgi:hypothetical protein